MILRGVIWLLSIGAALAVYRSARRRSPVLGAILALGVIGRAVVGVGFFVVSLFEIPVLRSLQAGGGFWTLAMDARFYFSEAAAAARSNLWIISESAPSPSYLRSFALWMRLAGISPASAVLFNLLCYLGVAAVILGLCRSRRVAVVVLGIVTFDPALVIFGTQALKDPLCVLIVALFVAGCHVWWEGVSSGTKGAYLGICSGSFLMALGVYGMGGIRAYIGLLMIVSVLVPGAISLIIRGKHLWRSAAAYMLLVVVLWAAFSQGASAYYVAYRRIVSSVVQNPSTLFLELDHARWAFLAAGGGTSLGEPVASSGLETLQVPKPSDRLILLSIGLGAMFIPISMLRALSLVSFRGGQGLLLVTDVDTVVIDVALACCLYLSFQSFRRRRLPLWPAGLCVTVLALLTTLLLAYVVTNYGTLFRLRLLAVTPLWLLPAVLDGISDNDCQQR